METIVAKCEQMQSASGAFTPAVRQTVRRFTDSVFYLHNAAFSNEEEMKAAEAEFVRSYDPDLLVFMLSAPSDVWSLLQDTVARKFGQQNSPPGLLKVPLAGAANPQPRPWRVAHSILGRLQQIDPESVTQDEMELFTSRFETQTANLTSSTPQSSGNADGHNVSQVVQQTPQTENREARNSRIKRTVKFEFDGGADTETAKFSGDLSVAPSFDLFERRYRHVMAKFAGVLTEREKVSFLSDALEGPALVYFLNVIDTDSTRSGSSIDDRNLGSSSQDLRPSAQSMSAAFNMLDSHFCSHQARLALRQKLVSLRLSQLVSERVTKPDALRLLQRKIERLSANGPPSYRDEAHRIDALRSCLDGEAWAVDTFATCEQNANVKTLQQYIDHLASYCQTKAMIAPRMTGSSPTLASIINTPDPPLGVNFGESRSTPRPRPRRRYSGHQPMSPYNSSETRARGRAAGLPRGDELKQMLKNIVCWRCGQMGHYSSKCTQPRRTFKESAAAFVEEGHGTPEEALFWLSAQFDESVDVCHAEEQNPGSCDPDAAEEDDVNAVDEMFAAFVQKPDF